MIRFRALGALDLRDDAGGELRSVLAQPKRLALLAYLALETPAGFCRRDRLLALFWPEASAVRARLALRQALHFLRRELGVDVVLSRGDDEVGLADNRLWCDAVAFDRAVAEGRLYDALDLYSGDLLREFFVADASPDFEQWLDGQRARLRACAAHAAWRLAEKAEGEGNAIEAALQARDAARLAPDDEAGLRRLLSLLDRVGDRVGALRVYEDFTRHARDEFDVEPAAETRALIGAVRAREAVTSSGVAVEQIKSTEPTRDPQMQPHQSKQRPRAAPWQWLAFGLVGLVATVAVIATVVPRNGPKTPPLLAVGWIENEAGSASAETARLLPGLLATDLGGVDGLAVISDTRLLEVLAQLGKGGESVQAVTDAAQRTGAHELLQGVLYRHGDTLRLELRRVDVRSGVVRDAYTAEGADAFELASRATAIIARAFSLDAPARRLAESSTGSLIARRLYEEGVRAFYRGDWRDAHDLFVGALTEDSAFAMAAFYAGSSRSRYDYEGSLALLRQANRFADRAPERERLLIKLTLQGSDYRVFLPVAETLAARFPNEPDGHFALGSVRFWAGDFLSAMPHLRRVLVMDSLSLAGKVAVCRACDAYRLLINAYSNSDSLLAAERTAREWIRRQPSSSEARIQLAETMSRQGRRDLADLAIHEAEKLQPGTDFPYLHAKAAIRADDFVGADQLLRARLAVDPRDTGALWHLVISLRNQGQVKEALVLARQGRALLKGDPGWRLAEAQALFESGFPRAAGIRFDSIAHFSEPLSAVVTPGSLARQVSWPHALAATAWAAAGDTARLPSIVDSLEAVVNFSSYGRDWRLPDHVRGLLWQARGLPERAVQSFRAAIFSPTVGYTRSNLELARELLRLGRPAESVPLLQSALRGDTESANYYVTRTELHELLALSFQQANQPDSAAFHYRKVIAAWDHGDPAFKARADTARNRLAHLTR